MSHQQKAELRWLTPHSSRDKPLLFAYLAWEPTLYPHSYKAIPKAARDLASIEKVISNDGSHESS